MKYNKSSLIVASTTILFATSFLAISPSYFDQVSASSHYLNEMLYTEKLLDDCHEYVLSLGASISDVDCVYYSTLPDPTLYESAKEYVDLHYPELVENAEATEVDEEKEDKKKKNKK
jgi:hypothetical protein